MRYKTLEPQLKHLYKFKDYLSIKDDLVFYKDPVFVPISRLYWPEEAFNCWTLDGQNGGNKDVH